MTDFIDKIQLASLIFILFHGFSVHNSMSDSVKDVLIFFAIEFRPTVSQNVLINVLNTQQMRRIRKYMTKDLCKTKLAVGQNDLEMRNI